MIDMIGNFGLVITSSIPEPALFEAALRSDGVEDPALFSALGEADEAGATALLADPARAGYLARAQFRLGQFQLCRFSLFAPKPQVVARAAETFAQVSADGSVFRAPVVKGAALCMATGKEEGAGRGAKKIKRSYFKLGQEIARLREVRKLSQYRLVVLAGIRQDYLSNIEQGKAPGRKHWSKLERALELEAGYLANKAQEFGLSRHNLKRGRVQPLSRRTAPRVGLFKDFGEAIARLRIEANLTQQQLADQTAMHFTALARIESGSTPGWKHHTVLEREFGLAAGRLREMLREMGLPGLRVECPATAKRRGPSILFGQEVRCLRVAKEMTGSALASKMGMLLSAISAIETGHRMCWSHLERLEKALGVEQGYFRRKLGEWGLPDSEAKSRVESASSKIKKGVKRPWERLGEEIRRLRLERDWNGVVCAQKVGIGARYLNRMETGRDPGFEYHPLFEKAFGLKRGYFAAKLKEWGLPQSLSESRRRVWALKKARRS